MGLWDFLTADYATRQQRTRDLNDRLDGLLDYYLGPTGIPDKLQSINTLLNPIDQMHEAGGQTVVAFDPTRSKQERMQAALNAGINTITAAAPAIGGAIAGQTARQAVMETIANVTRPLDDRATRFIADEDGALKLWHGSPYDFDRFSMDKIGTGEGAQDLGRGFSLTDSQGEAILYTNPASRWLDLDAMDRYRRRGPGRYYQVDVNASSEHFLDWNAPWRSQVQEGTPLFDKMLAHERRLLSIYGDDPAMVDAIPQASISRMWEDGAGFEDAATQSGFVGNRRRNYSGDTEYTVFDPSVMSIVQKFDKDGNTVAPLPAPRNEAEAMARNILDLRAAGRASEVTDEMMAAADPQYMFKNTPLPMDEASRMARADQYWPTDAYHSSRSEANFPTFRPGSRGSVYLANSPDGAARGAAGEALGSHYSAPSETSRNQIIPLRINPQDVKGLSVNVEEFDALPDVIRSESEIAKVADAVRAAGLKYWDDAYISVPNRDGSGFTYYKNPPSISAYADLEDGMDAFGYRLPSWNSGSDIPSLERAAEIGKKAFMVSDEAGSSIVASPDMSMRSRFARFDPEFRHLANLSAGFGGLALGGLLGQYQDEQWRERAGLLGM